MLITKDLQFSYHRSEPLIFPDIQCQRGESWLITGQSGSGKTTLLHLLAGLLQPDTGQVLIENTDIATMRMAALDRFRGRTIGIVFQKPYFIKSISIAENLTLAQSLAGLPVHNDTVTHLLSRLNILNKKNNKPGALSQGELQRASIARAIVNRPAVILADEPTSALDDKHTKEVVELLEEEAAAVNATLVIVTHDTRLKHIFKNQIAI